MPSSDAVNTLTAETTVAETLRTFPSATAVFLRRRMHCPGCHMAGFMTLAEAARTYGIAADELLADIRAASTDALGTSIFDLDQTRKLSGL